MSQDTLEIPVPQFSIFRHQLPPLGAQISVRIDYHVGDYAASLAEIPIQLFNETIYVDEECIQEEISYGESHFFVRFADAQAAPESMKRILKWLAYSWSKGICEPFKINTEYMMSFHIFTEYYINFKSLNMKNETAVVESAVIAHAKQLAIQAPRACRRELPEWLDIYTKGDDLEEQVRPILRAVRDHVLPWIELESRRNSKANVNAWRLALRK